MIITGKKFSKPEMSRVINGDVVLGATDQKPETFRLDHLLVEKHPVYNRSTLQTFIKSGFVKVDDKIVTKSNQKFPKSAQIELSVPKTEKKKIVPDIIYEDANVLVINKPAGLLSMAKGEYCPEPTLEDFGLLVHRLDRDTSGVVILAKDEKTRTFLQKQFQDRKAHKTYFAVVSGCPKLDAAKIDLPIARDLKHPTTFRVDPSGKNATTFYELKKTTGELSLLELKPITGRTHQLRIHLAYLGTPILGDKVYGKENARVPRLFLHAASLEITLPGGVRQTFSAPLPPEFDEIFH